MPQARDYVILRCPNCHSKIKFNLDTEEAEFLGNPNHCLCELSNEDRERLGLDAGDKPQIKKQNVHYEAEVTSLGKDPDNEATFKIGDRFKVDAVDFPPLGRKRQSIAFYLTPPSDGHKIYALLSDCAHLSGGTWKLIPILVEEDEDNEEDR